MTKKLGDCFWHDTTLTALTVTREWVMLVHGRARADLRLERPRQAVRLVSGPVRPERRNPPGRTPVPLGQRPHHGGEAPPPALDGRPRYRRRRHRPAGRGSPGGGAGEGPG